MGETKTEGKLSSAEEGEQLQDPLSSNGARQHDRLAPASEHHSREHSMVET